MGKKKKEELSEHIVQLPDESTMRKNLVEASNAILYVDRLYPTLLESAGNKVGPDDLSLMVLGAVQNIMKDQDVVLGPIATEHLTDGFFLEKVIVAMLNGSREEIFFRSAFHRQASKNRKLVHF